MHALIGVKDCNGYRRIEEKRKGHSIWRKKMEERKRNIFSLNYSVGTVLCTVECPRMEWHDG